MATIRVPLVPRALRWAAVVLIAGVIFYSSLLATPPQTVDPRFVPSDLLDKWRHFLAYGALAGSLWYAALDWELPIGHVVLLVLGTAVVYGIGIEYGQSVLPDRYFSLLDICANVLGGSFALPLLALRERIRTVSVP